MSSEIVGAEVRRLAVRKALADDATIQSLTVSPYVVARARVTAVSRPVITLGLTPGAEGRVGWRGGVVERFAVDVWVEESASVDDPPRRADQITDAILAALTAANLRAALVGLTPTVTGVDAQARIAAPFSDADELGGEGAVRKTGDIEVEFLAA